MIKTGSDPNSGLTEIHPTQWSWPACWGILALLVICTNWTGAARQSAGQNEPIKITKKDILEAVKKIRSRTRDLTVSFSFNALGGPPGMYRSTRTTAVVKGSKTYFDHEYGGLPKDDSRILHSEIAYNGERTTSYSPALGRADVVTKKDRRTRTQGNGFFDVMLLNPPRRHYQGRSDRSLISLLRSRASRLRGYIEIVDGHPCHVIDLYYQPNLLALLFGAALPKRPAMTVWLDRERGFLPVRSVSYTQPDFKKTQLQYVIDESVEIEECLWFAVKGRKSVYGGMAPTEYVLEVDGWKDGNPSIAVNTGIEDEFFDLWKRLPPGTRVWDRDADAANKGMMAAILVGALFVLAVASFVTIRLGRRRKGSIVSSARRAPGPKPAAPCLKTGRNG